MTKTELVAFLARRKAEADIGAIAWADVVTAVQALDAGQKQAIVTAIRQRKVDVGRILVQAVLDLVESRATTAVQTALADDTLTVTELGQLIP
jgi:hypothetical protein